MNDIMHRVEGNISTMNEGLENYLLGLGLPTEKVLVEHYERMVVLNNLPGVVKRVSPDKLEQSVYISKFIAACGVGLFDAAINFLWNEIIVNLRNKVLNFGMDYFLDSIIKDPKRRGKIKDENDLKKIDDWELIEGCKNIGILTEIGYKHLDYIRDMRNHASAAHPNHNDIDGLQISSWLQTCIKEVLATEPAEGAIVLKTLLTNIREHDIKPEDAELIKIRLKGVPENYISTMLQGVFGMYTTPDLDAKVRKNLNLLIKEIWKYSNIETKKSVVLTYATFAANAEIIRKNFAKDFLTEVDGLKYLSDEQKAIEIDSILDNLLTAHRGWNNFSNEVAPARMLAKYIPETGEVPDLVREKYVKNIIICRLGNNYGVSNEAAEYYDELIEKFTEKEIEIFVSLIFDSEINNKLKSPMGYNIYSKISNNLVGKVINPILNDMIQMIQNIPSDKISLLKQEKSFMLKKNELDKE